LIKTTLFKNKQSIIRLWVILLVWTTMQFLLFKRYGLTLEGESIKYFREAENFLYQGTFSSPKYWFYSTYIFIHIFFRLIGFETIGVYLFQSLLNLAGILLFYKALTKLTRHSWLPFISCLYLCTLFPLQQFNTYLYTESLFISLSTCWIAAIIFSENNYRKTLPVILLSALLLFTRPTGIYFCVITLIWFVLIFFKERRFLPAGILLIAGSLVTLFVVNKMMQGGGELDFWLPFEEKHILCGVPTGNLPVEKQNYQGIGIFFDVFQQQPKAMFQLMLQRAASFWSTTRDFYSADHNILHMLWFYPLFLGSLISLRFVRKNILVQIVLMSAILFTFSVMLTCDDWMNRFILPLIPLLIVTTVIGLKKINN
jgi:hypothetical protein